MQVNNQHDVGIPPLYRDMISNAEDTILRSTVLLGIIHEHAGQKFDFDAFVVGLRHFYEKNKADPDAQRAVTAVERELQSDRAPGLSGEEQAVQDLLDQLPPEVAAALRDDPAAGDDPVLAEGGTDNRA